MVLGAAGGGVDQELAAEGAAGRVEALAIHGLAAAVVERRRPAR